MVAAPQTIVTHLHCRGSYVVFVQAGRVIYDIDLNDIHREIDNLEQKRWFTSVHRAQLLAVASCGLKPSSHLGGL
jgi:hypothetical protein